MAFFNIDNVLTLQMEGSLRNALQISTTSSPTHDSRGITLFINLQNQANASSVRTIML